MSARKVWTEADIRALGVRCDGVTAVRIVYGVGRTRAYEILRAGDVDFRVIRVPGSNRYVVPTADVIRLLFGAPVGERAAEETSPVELAAWRRAG